MQLTSAVAKDDLAFGEVDVSDGIIPLAITGSGPSLILLHGWTLDHRAWQPQMAALGEHFRLIMPDRRGFGRSTAPPDLRQEADDVIRIADALDLDKFALGGLSQGAAVALDVAIKYPDRLTAAVLAGTPLPGLVPDPDTIPREVYAALVQQAAIKTMRRNWLQHPLMRVSSIEGEALLAEIVADYEARDLLRPSMLPPFNADSIAALSIPILAMAGGCDTPWRIACARFLAETAPLGELSIIPGGRHIVNVSAPDSFNTALREFLTPHAHLFHSSS